VPDILAAVDETALNVALLDAEAALGTQNLGPAGGSWGPFAVSASLAVSVSGGTVSLVPPNEADLANFDISLTASASLTIDLNQILPQFCLPRVCFWTPWGDVCTPQICVSWPVVVVPVTVPDTVTVSADFLVNVHLTGGQWLVDIVIKSVPFIDLGAAALAIITAIGAAAAIILLAVPFIGPFLSLAVSLIVAAIDVTDVTGLLGPLITPFISGLTFTVYKQAQNFQVLPAGGPFDPAVLITLNTVTADVEATDKNELVLSVDI